MITEIHKEVHVHSFANKTITITFLKVQQEDFPEYSLKPQKHLFLNACIFLWFSFIVFN